MNSLFYHHFKLLNFDFDLLSPTSCPGLRSGFGHAELMIIVLRPNKWLHKIHFLVAEARPKWQFLPPVPGYVPVYIRAGDTPLEEINPDLAEAFHALPAGRSAGKHVEASPEVPDQPQPEEPQGDQPQPEEPRQEDPKPEEPSDSIIDRRPYEKKILEKKKKASADIPKPVERR